MTTANGGFTIVFNGEIYNAPALRSALEKEGAQFQTDHSDTEVVLQMYVKHGHDMLNKLNGMFAFTIYDRIKGLLFCARDRLGIKPFYYVQTQGRFAFASELKSLLCLPFIERKVNRISLSHYMSLMYVPGEHTIIEGVKRLPAGHSLIYRLKDRVINITRWWMPAFASDGVHSEGELVDKIREDFQQAVRRWTLSDVPLGCSLSGGLDSSSIVGSLAQSGQKVKTYSLGFIGAKETQWNELPLARQVARKWGTEHHELVLSEDSLLEDLLLMVWHLDEPYGGGLPSWTVFKFMSQDVKVGVTGTGGDELFGNYGKWRPVEGSLMRRLLSKRVTPEHFEKTFFDRFYYLTEQEKRRIVFGDWSNRVVSTSDLLWRYYSDSPAECIRDKIAHVDFCTQLPEEFLMMTDRFSMAHSLEARTPFLDHEFLELVLSIPSNIRTSRRDLKGLLRRSLAPLLPAEILDAPKKGFVIPLTLWLRGRLRPLVERTLSPAALKRQEIFKPEFYATFVKPHLEGRADHTNRVWAALMFQLWHHLYIDAEEVTKPSYGWEDIAA